MKFRVTVLGVNGDRPLQYFEPTLPAARKLADQLTREFKSKVQVWEQTEKLVLEFDGPQKT